MSMFARGGQMGIWRAGLMQKLHKDSQQIAVLDKQYRCWRDSWQQVHRHSCHHTRMHLKQQHRTVLQLASHEFHLQYWNMQRTRRLVASVEVSAGLQCKVAVKLWSPQTSADMPRLDAV